MCSIQRPLDAKDQPRGAVEAEAVLGILTLCEAGILELMLSDALLFEIARNPHPIRKEYALRVAAKAAVTITTNDRIVETAKRMFEKGVKPVDALHLACALVAEADYFCTCDDRLLKRARTFDLGRTKALSPLELIMEVSQ